jgi:hypothetical protein
MISTYYRNVLYKLWLTLYLGCLCVSLGQIIYSFIDLHDRITADRTIRAAAAQPQGNIEQPPKGLGKGMRFSDMYITLKEIDRNYFELDNMAKAEGLYDEWCKINYRGTDYNFELLGCAAALAIIPLLLQRWLAWLFPLRTDTITNRAKTLPLPEN